ncbi:MAG: ribose transport system substrate-binding protein [Candidatus Atribacteria bacterium]|nr:ribose transport system substrate-binding protein [Candidatus Atribacteria bacterium]
MKRSLLAVLTVSLLVLVLVGGVLAQEKAPKIAYISGILDPFQVLIGEGIKDKGAELGMEVFIAEHPKAWGPEVQVPILEAVAARGDIDLIAIVPTSQEALIAPLKRIYESGVEIITVDTYLGDGDYSTPSEWSFPLTFIGTDNFQGGVEVAHRLAEMIGGKGKVFVETTNPDVSSVVERVEGFKQGISEYPDIELVGVEYCLDVQEKAQQQVAAALQANPDIVGIFGTNLYSAQGAYQAVVNAGLKEAVKIATWDATEELIQALRAGQVDLVLAQKPYEIGTLAAEWAYKYLVEGQEVPKRIVPGFFFFTAENVDDPEAQQYIYKLD